MSGPAHDVAVDCAHQRWSAPRGAETVNEVVKRDPGLEHGRQGHTDTVWVPCRDQERNGYRAWVLQLAQGHGQLRHATYVSVLI